MYTHRLLGYFAASLASLACCLVACTVEPLDEEDSDSLSSGVVSQDGGTEATLTVPSQWHNGYCANVTIKNLGERATTGWRVVVGLNGATMSNGWNATITQSNGQLSAVNVDYNGTVAKNGGTASFGFCANGAGVPTLVSVTGTGNGGGNGGSSTSTSSSSTSTSSSSSTSSGAGGSGGSGGAGGSGGSGGSGGGGSGGGGTPGEKFVGNITTRNAVERGFERHWDQITPENEGKWGSVERSRGQRDWSALDRIYQFAQQNNIIFKQHVFVWGSQQPTWITQLSAADQRQAVRDWMQAFCQRYPDTKYIDVVNEPPPHTTPSYKNAIGGDGASGYDWIVNSFKWARELCPNAVLILNDYNNIEYEADHQNFMKIARAVIQAGAPVDALGAQAHDAYKINTATVKRYIDQLASLGKPVHITEYDIGLADDNQQKRVMEEQFTMFYTHPKVTGITLWGHVIGATWRANTGLQQANDGPMRPAMTWLMSYLGRQ
ncbi:endo-1,4-beta-xylanase [Sorangium sp. So ce1036]|uniref:endo-1,4-beta-xylanase n=1 Tax=Sorangium sp. So ce1036 TaxID=3133328 RepID=UPI003F06D021